MPLMALMSPYFFSIQVTPRHSIRDGGPKPAVAATEPAMPAIFVPAKVAALMPTGPGVIWEMVKISMNSFMVSQWYLSTTAACIHGMEA